MAKLSKQQMELYAVIALILVAAAVAAIRFLPKAFKGTGASPVAAPVDSPYEIPKLPEGIDALSASTLRARATYAPPSRDIFAPADRPQEDVTAPAPAGPPPPLVLPLPPPLPVLSGTMKGVGGVLAILDGRVVGVSETFRGFKVVEIRSDSVVLLHGTNLFVLRRPRE
jgi:hypothetical protein